jgi:HSP90 family molecular chaperone
MKRHHSFDELSELIVEAIIDEPIFSKEKLLPRIKSILKVFNLSLSVIPNIEKEETATEKHKRLLHIQTIENQVVFWKNKCKEHLPEKMEEFYKEADELKL